MNDFLAAVVRQFPLCFAAFVIWIPTSSEASPITLACYGEVALMEGGKQTNPVGEKSSLSIRVDVDRKTLIVADRHFSIEGDGARETIVSMDRNLGSLSLDRITGSVTVHLIEPTGLKLFYGNCQRANPLF